MAEELAGGVYWLSLGWPTPLGGNAFLVDDGEVTLIDAGLPVNINSLRGQINAAGYSVSAIDRVLITHYDIDHFGGLSRLVPALDAPVYLGEQDHALLQGTWDPPLLHHKGLFHRVLRFVYRVPGSLSYYPLADGEEVGGFRVIHTPGHNPGHVIYYHASTESVFLGDLIWESGGELTPPVWLDSYDVSEIHSSISRAVDSLPSFELACMAHGSPIQSDGSDRLRSVAVLLGEAE